MSTAELPDGWTRVKFGDVVRNVNETSRNLEGDGIERVVGLDHLDPGSLRLERWDDLSDLPDGTTFTRKFKPGQVLFGKRRAYQRKVAVPDFEGVCSGDILVFEPTDKRMLAEFLPYLVQSDGFFDHALGTSAGSLSPRTKWAELAKYEFALPPLDEQQRISDLLRAADDLDDRYARATAARADLLDALLARAAVDTDALTLEALCGEPITYGIVQAGPEYDGGVPYVRVSDMTAAESLADATLPRTSPAIAARYGRSACRAGELIFALRGPIGLTRVVPESLDGVNLTQGTARLSPDTAKVSVDYLQWALRSRDVQDQFRRLKKGSTFQELSLTAVRKIRLRIPDLHTQKVIVETLSAVDAVGTCSQSSRAAVASLARSIREVSLRGGM